MTPREFVDTLLDRGIEPIVRRGKLKFWPWRPDDAWRQGMTIDEQAYVAEHYDALLAEVSANPRETTVVWDGRTPAPTVPPPAASDVCPGCGRATCDPSHWAYGILHPRDPAVVAAQNAEMFEALRRERRER
jgi:hypothetical protein